MAGDPKLEGMRRLRERARIGRDIIFYLWTSATPFLGLTFLIVAILWERAQDRDVIYIAAGVLGFGIGTQVWAIRSRGGNGNGK